MDKNLSWSQAIFFVVIIVGYSLFINKDPADEVKNNNPPAIRRPTTSSGTPIDISRLVKSELATQRANEKALRIAKGAATEAYWNVNVAFMHRLRFAVQDSDQPFGQYFLNSIQKYQTALQKTRTTVVPDSSTPDPDLVRMVNRHIKNDEQGLELILQFKQILGSSDEEILKMKKSAKDQIAFGELLLNNVDLEKLPPAIQVLFKQLLAFQERQFDMLYEIEIMQAVLKERYPGTRFDLPDLETTP